jgi:uncharacterized protein YjiS (DUF1127 family)
MNAYVSKEELTLLPTSRISHPEHYAEASHQRAGFFGGLVNRVANYLSRQATLAELNNLSDRELADIGLNRADMAHVFKPSFARQR